MNASLVMQLCGWPLLVSLVLLERSLVVAAIWLVTRARRENLLQAFLPLTATPMVVGLFSSLVGLLSSIGMQLNESADVSFNSSFLLQMNLVPLLIGCVAALPAACVVIAGRWALAWKASGLRLLPEKPAQPEDVTQQHAQRETDDYLERLVRSR